MGNPLARAYLDQAKSDSSSSSLYPSRDCGEIYQEVAFREQVAIKLMKSWRIFRI